MMKRPQPVKPALFTALEPRILLDGAAIVEATEALTDNDYAHDTPEALAVAPESSQTSRREIVFIDAALPDVETLIEGVDDHAEVFLIEAHENGLQQMAQLLDGLNDVDAIHILGHGDIAQATIGNSIISNDTLDINTQLLKEIGSSLSADGDILLYGCNVAASDAGIALVEKIAQITQADIAASDDLTGAKASGGDWELEKNSGHIETQAQIIENYKNTLADVATGKTFTENAITTPRPIIDGVDISSEISVDDYHGGTVVFSLNGDAVYSEDITLQTNGSTTGDLSFDTSKKVIFDDAVRIGNYYTDSGNNSITVELENTFYNGDFQYYLNESGWVTSAKNSDPLTSSLSSDASESNNQMYLYGNAILSAGNAGSTITGASFHSSEYIPLDDSHTIAFDYRANDAGDDNFIISAYLEPSGGGANFDLLNQVSGVQDGTVHNFSANLTGLAADNYRLVIISGAEDTDNNFNVNWDMYVDNIKVTTSTPPGIDETTISELANAVHYSQLSSEQLRGYADTTPLNKGLLIRAYDSSGSLQTDFSATFNVTPVNDTPTSSYSSPKGTVFYSTPGYELDIFNNIQIMPVENIQTITSVIITVDGINQPTDEYLIYDDGNANNKDLMALTDGSGTLNGIAYNVTTATDPNNAGRFLATVTLNGNWATTDINETANVSEYSLTLATFLNDLKFRNNAINTTDTVDRRITLAQVTDSGSNSGANNNIHTPNYTTTIQRVPVLTVTDTSFDEAAGTPVSAGAAIDINNLESTVSIVSSTVRITGGYTDGDELIFDSSDSRFIVNQGIDNDGFHYLSLTSNPANNAILLISEWETALQAIKFDTPSDYPDENPTRTLKWEVNDGLARYIPEYSIISIIEQDDLITLPNGNSALISTPHNTNISFDASSYFLDPDDVITYSSPDLPSGLSINNVTGEITGKLSGIDPADFINGEKSFISTITADNTRPDSNSITLTITVTDDSISITGSQPDLILSQNSSNLLNMSAYFTDSDDNLFFDADGLPPGLNINISSGVISGSINTIPETDLTDGKKIFNITVYATNYALDANGNIKLDVNGDAIVKEVNSFTFDITVAGESLSVSPWSGKYFDVNGTPVSVGDTYNSSDPNENTPSYSAAGSVVALFKEASSSSLIQGEHYAEFTLKISNVSNPGSEYLIADGAIFSIADQNRGTFFTADNNQIDFSIEHTQGVDIVTFKGSWSAEQLNRFLKSLAYRNDSALPDAKTGRFFTIATLEQSDGDKNDLNNARVEIKRLSVLYTSSNSYNEGNPPTPATDNLFIRNLPADTVLFGATIQITNNFTTGDFLSPGEDKDIPPGISTSYNDSTGTLTISSATGLGLSDWEKILNNVTYHTTIDVDNSSKLTRTLTWTVKGDPAEIDRYQPDTSNIKIIPVLGLTNTFIQYGLLHEKNTSPAFSNFAEPVTYSATGLPEGLNIDSTTGIISGYPDPEGEYEITINIAAADGTQASDSYTLNVLPIPLSQSRDNNSNTATDTFKDSTSFSGTYNGGNSSGTNSSVNNSFTADSGSGSSAATPSTGNNGMQWSGYLESAAQSDTQTRTQATAENSEQAADATKTQADAQAVTETAGQTQPAGIDTANLSQASLNTVENAAGTLAAVFDSGVPAGYAPQPAELNPPGIDQINVTVGADGQLQIISSSGRADSAGYSGMTIVDIEQQDNNLNILISDENTNSVVNYSASLQNGRPLPDWLSIDPQTGQVSGEIPAGTGAVNLRIQAVDQDGTVRMLEIQLTLPKPPQTPLSLQMEFAPDTGNSGFSSQLAEAFEKQNNPAEKIISALQMNRQQT